VLAFDRAAARILPLGASLRDMPPANQRDIIRHIVERVEMHVRDVGRIIVRPEAAPFFESCALGATKDATHEVDGCGEYAQHNDPLNQSHYVHSSACSCVAPPEGRADRITLLVRYA
jgi:hypothetical protein